MKCLLCEKHPQVIGVRRGELLSYPEAGFPLGFLQRLCPVVGGFWGDVEGGGGRIIEVLDGEHLPSLQPP